MKTLKKKISKGMTKKKFYNKMNKWKRTVKKYSHDVNKLGYRSDCSGLVSYLWGLPKKIAMELFKPASFIFLRSFLSTTSTLSE